jgi:hypothetical protein
MVLLLLHFFSILIYDYIKAVCVYIYLIYSISIFIIYLGIVNEEGKRNEIIRQN